MLPILPADMPAPLPVRSSASMIIGGLFLAAFFVVAGILIVRKKRRKQTLGVVLLLAGLCARGSFADIPPRPPQGTAVEFEVTMDYAAAGGPILRIPKSALAAAHAGGVGGGMEQVIGGVFLSSAILLAGVWFVRRRRLVVAPVATVGAVALVAVGVSFVAGALWAQQRERRITQGDLNGAVEPGQTRSGVVALQIVSGDKASLLFAPPRRRPGPPR